MDQIKTYENFSKNTINIKNELIEFLKISKKNGKKVVCYGAPAKGNTLLNYCKIFTELIEYTVDKNPHKQNLFCCITCNYHSRIEQMNYINNWGGRFVIPIPKVSII